MYLDQPLPLCDNNCGNQAIRFTKKGKAVCSDKPAGCPTVLKRMQKTSIERYGVPNASSTKEVKEKRREKSLAVYGVDNVSKAKIVTDIIGQKNSAAWARKTQKIIESSKNAPLNLTKKQYHKIVGKITEYMYSKNMDLLDPERKRGKAWHVDHCVSVFFGFYSKIPPHIIGDINNLRLLAGLENETKRQENSMSIEELMHKYNAFYKCNELVTYDTAFFKPNHSNKPLLVTPELGTCKYCSNEAHYVTSDNKIWCCSSHRNRCPTIKEKNSSSQLQSEIKKLATAKRYNKHFQS